MSYILVLTTTPDINLANSISNSLIEKKLAACIAKNEIFSTYRWNDKIENAKEIELKIKTKLKNFKKIKEVILSLHMYDTPEIIAIPIIKGNKKYLKFIDNETKG